MNDNSEDTSDQGVSEPRRRIWIVRPVLLLIALLIAGVGGYHWWQYSRVHVSTENAYVQGHIVQIASRVPGTVTGVLVEDNQQVAKGDVLVELDQGDYEVAVKQEEARVQIAEARLGAAKLGVPLERDQTEARVTEAEARVARMRKSSAQAESELERAREQVRGAKATLGKLALDKVRISHLRESGVMPQENYDEVVKLFDVAEANYQAATAQERASEARVQSLEKQIHESLAQVALAETGTTATEIRHYEMRSLEGDLVRAQASLEQARLNLSYTTIKAPVAGVVSEKTVELGHRIQPGQALMALVPLDDLWVVANYKETQLTNVRVGQPVKIKADVYPGYTYQGKVESISAGTGAIFSLLPPENATGNWVKVVQRVPVKIVLTNRPPPSDKPLRVGLSVKATINTSSTAGAHRAGRARGPSEGEEDTIPLLSKILSLLR